MTTSARRQAELAKHASELGQVLTPHEMALLAQYLCEEWTQMAIARSKGMGQTTVSLHIRNAVAKLKAAQLPVPPLPRRGPRPRKTHVVDPEAMERMVTDRDAAGAQRGRWVDSRKVERSE